MAKMLDTYQTIRASALAPQLFAQGFSAIGSYYFGASRIKDLLTKERAQAFSNAGLWNVSLYESGNPTNVSYFTTERGGYDGRTAVLCAASAQQPIKTGIYICVDYDAAEADLEHIGAYFKCLCPLLLAKKYLVGVYGSGLTCRYLSEAGLVTLTMLSQSAGFSGFKDWSPHANIIQGPVARFLGLDVDLGETQAIGGGGWQSPILKTKGN